MVEGLGVALVAVLVILMVVRPLIVKAFEQPENEEEENLLMGPSDDLQQLPSPSSGGALTETDQLEELIDIAKVEGRVKASSVRKIGEIIDQHPEEAVSIIRSWMYSDE